MKKLKFVVVICLMGSFVFAGGIKKEPAEVKRIVDGDTVEVKYRGKTRYIRLTGINCPASRKGREATSDAAKRGLSVEAVVMEGKLATEFMESLIKNGDSISLEFDKKRRGRYKRNGLPRLLCYVYLSDGRMLNEVIVKQGYATVMSIWPNYKYKGKFLKALESAKTRESGLWGLRAAFRSLCEDDETYENCEDCCR